MSKGAAPQIHTLSASDNKIKLWLWGDTGVGKTTFAATANQHEILAPALIVNFDNGLSSISHIEGFPYVDVTNNDEMLALVNEFLKPEEKRREEYRGYNTLIVDSLSKWRDQTINSLVEGAIENGSREFRRPLIQDFGEMTYTIGAIMSALAQLRVNLIVTAGLDEEKDESGLITKRAAPLVTPKLRQSISHMMDWVWHMQIKDGEYRLLTLPKSVYQIKTRNPLFANALRNESRRLVYDQLKAKAEAKYEQLKEAKPDAKARKDDVSFDALLEGMLKGAEGWFVIGMDDNSEVTPNLADMYDLYLNSVSRK